MARVTHVKKAQQRYEMVPVIDPETGEQKRTPVMRGGAQRTTKRGKPIFMSVTKADKTKPLPNYKCGSCGKEIEVGTPYKHISPKSGPYGGRTLRRCETCPTWRVWEYSSSLGARTAQIAFDAEQEANSAETLDDFRSAAENAAQAVRELADEKRESASNIEDGFGHSTYQSDELTETADSLDEWANEIENVDFEEEPEPEEQECERCEGDGKIETTPDGDRWTSKECPECEGTGRVTPDEPTDEQLDEWRDAARSELIDAVGNCPV